MLLQGCYLCLDRLLCFEVFIFVVVRQLLIVRTLVIVDTFVLRLGPSNASISVIALNKLSDRSAFGNVDSRLISLALVSIVVARLHVAIAIVLIFVLPGLLCDYWVPCSGGNWLLFLHFDRARLVSCSADLPLSDCNRFHDRLILSFELLFWNFLILLIRDYLNDVLGDGSNLHLCQRRLFKWLTLL